MRSLTEHHSPPPFLLPFLIRHVAIFLGFFGINLQLNLNTRIALKVRMKFHLNTT